jgi:HEAT repeat protein
MLSLRYQALCFALLVSFAGLAGALAAQDHVTLKPRPGENPIRRTGQISSISLDRGELLLLDVSGAILRIELETVNSVETSDPKLAGLWKEYQDSISGADGQGDDREFGPHEPGTDTGGVDDLPDAQTAEEVRKLLALLEKDPMAESAIVEIGPLATPQVLSELLNESDSVRMAACRILGRIRDQRPEVRRKLIECIGDECAGVRYEAVVALGRIGPEEPRVWEAMLEQARQEGVTNVMRALITCLVQVARIDSTASLRLLEATRAAENMVVYYYAGQAFLGNEEVADSLTRYMKAGLNDRAWLAEALATIDHPTAVRYLIEQLQSSSGSSVQEWEIIEVLRRITRKEFGYDPGSSRTARQAAVLRWVRWYSREGQAGEETRSATVR